MGADSELLGLFGVQLVGSRALRGRKGRGFGLPLRALEPRAVAAPGGSGRTVSFGTLAFAVKYSSSTAVT